MGSSFSKSASFVALQKGQVVTSSALRAELVRYAYPHNQLSKAKLKEFLSDTARLLGFKRPTDLIAALDFDERESFSIDFCVNLFVAGEAVPLDCLSESLKDAKISDLQVPPKQKQEKSVVEVFQAIEVAPGTLAEAIDPKKYAPPSLYFSREWSLIFFRNELNTKDLNNVALACRYFRTVLLKYPPPNWRTIKLSSLERRTAANMTEFTELDRLTSVCRLEIGCHDFGNMIQDSDLKIVCSRMKFLTSLKLVFCHLITDEWPLLCESLPGANRLQELSICRCKATSASFAVAFPQLQELRLISCTTPNTMDFDFKQLRRLMLVGLSSSVDSFNVPNLTHLWCEELNRRTDTMWSAILSIEQTPRLQSVVDGSGVQKHIEEAAKRGIVVESPSKKRIMLDSINYNGNKEMMTIDVWNSVNK